MRGEAVLRTSTFFSHHPQVLWGALRRCLGWFCKGHVVCTHVFIERLREYGKACWHGGAVCSSGTAIRRRRRIREEKEKKKLVILTATLSNNIKKWAQQTNMKILKLFEYLIYFKN